MWPPIHLSAAAAMTPACGFRHLECLLYLFESICIDSPDGTDMQPLLEGSKAAFIPFSNSEILSLELKVEIWICVTLGTVAHLDRGEAEGLIVSPTHPSHLPRIGYASKYNMISSRCQTTKTLLHLSFRGTFVGNRMLAAYFYNVAFNAYGF